MGGLNQYGAERFGKPIFATIRKKCGTERVKAFKLMTHAQWKSALSALEKLR